MSQPDLFSIAETWPAEPPSVRGSATSVAAAKAIEPRAGSKRREVYDAIQASGNHGMTDEEGIDALGMNPSTYRPRRGELAEAGFIRDSGRTRKTKSGLAAVVWIVARLQEAA